jgi:hypothetical protein
VSVVEPPVVSSMNASLLRAVGLEWSGEQKDMPVITELSALESATHVISHSGGEPPLPWPEPNSGPTCLLG